MEVAAKMKMHDTGYKIQEEVEAVESSHKS